MKLKYKTVQIILEAVGLLSITAMIVYAFIAYAYAPETIPVHFGADGTANSWADKSRLFFIPGVALLLYVLISVVTLFPSEWNIPYKITENNRKQVYSAVKTMVIAMKPLLVAVFFYIMYKMAQSKNLSVLFLPVSIAAIIITAIVFIVYAIYVSKKYA